MEQAILKTLKDAGGTYAFPNGLPKVVSLFCGGQPNIIKEVIVNSSFTEFATIATGRTSAIKIISACGDYTTYVKATKKDVETLQGCCIDTLSKFYTLSCIPEGGMVSVYNATGSNIGVATTPLEYVTVWNGDSENQLVGKLHVYPNWNTFDELVWKFSLLAYVGSYVPPNFLCVLPCPVVNVAVAGDTGNVTFTAQPGRSYTTSLFANSDGTGFISSVSYTNSTGVPQTGVHASFGGLPSGDYYIRVQESTTIYPCELVEFIIA